MTAYVLWRRLTETDFNAMHGNASPHGRGGGAMHVALGVRNRSFEIDRFLNAPGRNSVTIRTAAQPGNHEEGSLAFSSNPNRRGGEWLIRDQFSHRHPAWTTDAGFPATYEPSDPPYVLIFRVDDTYHARFTTYSRLRLLPQQSVPARLLSDAKGIAVVPESLLVALAVPPKTALDAFDQDASAIPQEPFNPQNQTDGRRRIITSIVQRLGQPAFRRKLLSAYATQCAITRCKAVWVLEAAHITPYRGIRTNSVSNGLLLRADVHTLFDLALIAIEPSRMRIRVSSLLHDSQYRSFDGKPPALPREAAVQPNAEALAQHYRSFHP